MKIKAYKEEWYQDYKEPSMYIAFPSCTFKCEAGCNKRFCQNSKLAKMPDIDVNIRDLIDTYLKNPISQALVCGGLEPFDSWKDLQCLVMNFRYWSGDNIVIYTGYNKAEIEDKLEWLRLYEPVVVKYGRFIPNQKPHYDDILGVMLASDNQYAENLTYERTSKWK